MPNVRTLRLNEPILVFTCNGCEGTALVLKARNYDFPAGWVHVFGAYAMFGSGSFVHTEELTQPQRAWLIGKGHRHTVSREQFLATKIKDERIN